ncbi:MAG: M28 family peptidase [Bacteroidia bacterium]
MFLLLLTVMKKHLPIATAALALFLFSAFHLNTGSKKDFTPKNDSAAVSMIYAEALAGGKAYENLRYLCKNIPPRLSGSPGAAAAVEYTYQLMQNLGLDSVWLQPCMVPHWERGDKETGKVVGSKNHGTVNMHIAALGGSLPTKEAGLKAEVIEVKSFEELEKLGRKNIQGKIVFFNYPFNPTFHNGFEAYGDASRYRWMGPSAAEKHGAVGVLVRSMTHALDTFPHTGVMRQDSLAATIPSAALSTVDAEILSKLLIEEGTVSFFMKMNCRKYPDALSYNVVGEIRGSEKPEEIIVFGGHLDAWDTGEGAHDDGAGCMQAIEILRTFKALGIKPKRTIRAVMWMNEENGGRGGDAYAAAALKNKEKHIAAIESDAGGFSPRGFGMDMPNNQKEKIRSWSPYFYPWGVYDFTKNGGGADIDPLKEQGCAQIGLHPDGQRYFDYHHTPNDIFENVNKRELLLGAGSMAALVYLIDKYGL